MARTSYIDIPAGLEESYYKGLKSGDRFLYSKIIRNDTLLSRARKKGISARSKFSELSILWATFSDIEKLAWKTAAGYSSLNGWQQFVQDQCLRYKNEMSGSSIPVIQHQGWIGAIKITSPATEIKLAQYHPQQYWISKKVRGTKNMRQPVSVSEIFSLPLQIGISYKSNLVACGPNPYAKFYAKIWNSYQGVNDEAEVILNLDLIHDWQIVTETLSSLRGTVIGYTLFIELHDLQGDLFFDNIKAIHNGTNWVRDPKCNNIDTTFTKSFYQVPKHWVAEILPNGSEYDSIFLDYS